MFLDEIGKKNKIVIGLDIANDYSQISYCRLNQSIPDTVSLVMGEEQYNIPTLLCRKHTDDTRTEVWAAGRDALLMSKEGEGDLVEDMVLLLKNGTSVCVGEQEYEPERLMEIFLRKLLSLVAAYTGGEAAAGIAFTLNEIQPGMCDILRKAAKAAAGSGCEVYFLSRQDCFFQYILHQPEEMWVHGVIMYEYRKGGIRSYDMQMNRNTSPVVCFIEEDYFPQMKMTDVSHMQEEQIKAFYTQLDSAFLEIIRKHCEKREITSAFLLGDIFSREWCKESLRYLCKGRRVFQGNNLFSKGACYGAREKIVPSTLTTSYVYLSEEKLRANIGMNCNRGKEEVYQPLLDAGTNWYDATKQLDLILARDNTLSIMVTPLDGGKPKVALITLDGLNVRGNKTNRIGLTVAMQDANTVKIEIEDKGFGEFFPSSGIIWKESFEL